MPSTPDAETFSAIDERLRALLGAVLGLSPERVAALRPESPLLGALPELDSMALAGLLTELEDQLSVAIDDEDVDGSLFETYGTLLNYVTRKSAR